MTMFEPESRRMIKFDETKETAIYIAFNAHAGSGVPQPGTFQQSLNELIEGYEGPEIFLDFCSDGRLRGIEILGDK